jgi:hypothetical protein
MSMLMSMLMSKQFRNVLFLAKLKCPLFAKKPLYLKQLSMNLLSPSKVQEILGNCVLQLVESFLVGLIIFSYRRQG